MKWPIKLFSGELVSGTADWSDTTNTLNNTVKHIHWCVLINKDTDISTHDTWLVEQTQHWWPIINNLNPPMSACIGIWYILSWSKSEIILYREMVHSGLFLIHATRVFYITFIWWGSLFSFHQVTVDLLLYSLFC